MAARRRLNGSIPNPAWVGSTFFGGLLCAGIGDGVASAAGSVSGVFVVPVSVGARATDTLCPAVAGSAWAETGSAAFVSGRRKLRDESTQRDSRRTGAAVGPGGREGKNRRATAHSTGVGEEPPAGTLPV